MPNAVCKSQTYTFDKSRILSNAAQFNGNPDTYDWTLDGGDFDVVDNALVMMCVVYWSPAFLTICMQPNRDQCRY